MYLKRRLRRLPPGRFIEVGAGEGQLSQLLLERGWTGEGFELGTDAVASGRDLNADAIDSGDYAVHQENWLEADPPRPADLVISSMVIEHLDDDQVGAYFDRAACALCAGGRAILIVPGAPGKWGIEDEIAGHYRRYTRASLAATAERAGWEAVHTAGLTYPLSNLLLPISNQQVERWEGSKRKLSIEDRTVASGSRDVPWKTSFPSLVGLLVNELTMLPFHLAQLATLHFSGAMVIYGECLPASPRNPARKTGQRDG